jgi:2,5-furandicarboxylate decarboxylase 1
MLDLQSFLNEHSDALLHIEKEVPLDNVGVLTGKADETIVFENLAGFPDFRLVDQLFVDRAAQARVLGCSPDQVVPTLLDVIRKGPQPLKEVTRAPCQEVVLLESDIDLAGLPIIRHTDKDPYPYTTSFAIHRDPETAQHNQMFPRCGVLDRAEMVASFVTSTANQILEKHREAGTKMPQAIVIGTHPAWELAGCYSYPHEGWWEMELFEAITGSPGEVVPCRTVDLSVPADASIVIEGYVLPDKTALDGPSPGPTMLYTPYATQQPVFEVTAITMRKDPVYRNHLMTPFTDHQEMPRLFHEAILYDRLKSMGFNVHDIHFSQGGGSLCLYVQMEPSMDGQVTDALMAVLGSPFLNTKMAVVVDPDIDIYDYREITYAMATRVDPSRDVLIVPNARAFPFDPSATPVAEAGGDTMDSRFPSTVGKWGIDATKPVPYRKSERRNYERAWPLNWNDVSLEDYL